MATPLRTALVGPSNTARNPSPVVVDLAPSIRVQGIAETSVVSVQQIAPGGVTDSLQSRGRVDDVGEEHGRERPLARSIGRDPDDPRARPLDRDPGLVADHPCVVAGRYLVDGVRRDVDRIAVVGLDPQTAPKPTTRGDAPGSFRCPRPAQDPLSTASPARTASVPRLPRRGLPPRHGLSGRCVARPGRRTS